MAHKIIAVDLDGTLLNSQSQLSDFKFNGSDLCYNKFPMVDADACNEQLNLVGLFISK